MAAGAAQKRSCQERLVTGAGVAQRTVRLPQASRIVAQLDADAGDWDLAVFDKSTGRMLAASAAFGAHEVAEGFALPGDVVVQACRRTGSASAASVTLSNFPLEKPDGHRDLIRVVNVATRNADQKRILQNSGLDLTEHGRDGFLQVVLYGDRDVRRLKKLGLGYTVVTEDLAKEDWLARRSERRTLARAAQAETGMPSGRTDYRRLPDIQEDLKTWAEDNPNLVKPITLPFRTLEGREVQGIEITENVNDSSDGKPVFVQLGVHHAREWPSEEMPMEWAFDLISGFGKDERTTRLLKRARVIMVPVVNQDGFNLSREAQADLGNASEIDPLVKPVLAEAGYPAGVDQPGLIAAILLDQESGLYAYKRRNCRLKPGETPAEGECGTRDSRLLGVDPNRNYGMFWGGGGASTSQTDDTYRGEAPFSEPETQNIRDLVSHRQVTTLITNHTYSNLILRPPGLKQEGLSPDEDRLKALGDAMAAQNGYTSQYGWQLYDTTGTTEDWSYTATGGLGYTFEIGPKQFHPPYSQVIDEYRGAGDHAGKGNREAYFLALESTADSKQHSVLSGQAEPGTTLRLSKTISSFTSSVIDTEKQKPSGAQSFEDHLDSALPTPTNGAFTWHVNQSQSPFGEHEHVFLTADDNPSRRGDLPYSPSAPGDDILIPVTIGPDDARDVFKAFIDVEDTDDYDIYLHKGTEVTEDNQVASGTNGFVGSDETLIYNNPEPGDYVVRINNFAGARPFTGFFELYGASRMVVPTRAESWTLKCEAVDGAVLSQRTVDVGRGESKDLGRVCSDIGFGGSGGDAGVITGGSGGFRFALALDLRRLRRALTLGIRARARCTDPCLVGVGLRVDRRTRRRLRLRSRTVARGSIRRVSGRGTFRVRFTRAARRALPRAKRVRLRIVGTAVQLGGARSKVVVRHKYLLVRRAGG